MQENAFHAQNAAVRVDRHPRRVLLAALLIGRNEVLAAVLGPLDRLAKLDRRPRHQDLFGKEQHDLGAEATAHVGCDHLDLELRQAEHVGQAVLDRQRRLGRVPDDQRLLQRIVDGHHAAGLDRAAARAFDEKVLLEHVRSLVESAFRVAYDLDQVRRDVARHVVVDQRLAGLVGNPKVDDGWQGLPIHLDQPDGIFGDVPIGGHDHGHGFADVAHLVGGQRPLGAAVGQARVRNHQRGGLVEVAQVGGGVDGAHARVGPRRRRVDARDPGVAIRAAQDRRVEHAGRVDIVDVRPQPAQQPRILVSTNRRHRSAGMPAARP